MLTFSTGLSRLLERSEPELALALYPLNADALVQKSTKQLSVKADAAALSDLSERIERLLHYNRLDARLFSLQGEISSQLHGSESGRRFFDHASVLSKTEGLTLRHMLLRSLQEGKAGEAVSYLDILLRRRPASLDEIAEALPALLNDPAGYETVIDRLRQDPPWRTAVIVKLAQEANTVAVGERLLFDMLGSEYPPRPREISASISGYLKQRRYDDAYRLFLFTLSDQERALAGYVFNGKFEHFSTGRPFDWLIRDRPGAEIRTAGGGREGERTGAVVRFLNKPVKTVTLQQSLHLPPGTYRLSLEASGNNLSLPKDLFWSLKCSNPNRDLGRLLIPAGDYDRRTVVHDFQIAPGSCPMQSLQLETGLIAESWRYRYSGTLLMHEVRIERLQR